MTIIEAIKNVLNEQPKGLIVDEIYKEICNKNLYVFGAKIQKMLLMVRYGDIAMD